MQTCQTDQFKNSFFVRTKAARNHLDNSTGHSKHVDSFKTALSAVEPLYSAVQSPTTAPVRCKVQTDTRSCFSQLLPGNDTQSDY